MAAKVSVAAQLRDLLTKATKTDLDEIDAEIAQEQKKLDALYEEASVRIKRLRANRKMLANALGIEDPRAAKMREAYAKKKAAKAGGGNGKPAARSVVDEDDEDDTPVGDAEKVAIRIKAVKVAGFIREKGRPMSIDISTQTGISRFGPGALGSVLLVEGWFHTNADKMVSLTDKGDRAFPAKK